MQLKCTRAKEGSSFADGAQLGASYQLDSRIISQAVSQAISATGASTRGNLSRLLGIITLSDVLRYIIGDVAIGESQPESMVHTAVATPAPEPAAPEEPPVPEPAAASEAGPAETAPEAPPAAKEAPPAAPEEKASEEGAPPPEAEEKAAEETPAPE